MTHLGVKACGKSEFDIFEAKKRFPNSRRPMYWSEKSQKSDSPHVFTPKGIISREKIFEKIHIQCDASTILVPKNPPGPLHNGTMGQKFELFFIKIFSQSGISFV